MWPELPYASWKDTLDTLHMWMQIVGKVKLALAPFINQWWEVAFYITPSGMTTGSIPYNDEAFEVDFDFLSHMISVRTSNGNIRVIFLRPRSVADFYGEFMSTLHELGIQVTIWPVPVEVPAPIPFMEDTKHASYEGMWATRWWRIVLQSTLIFDRFRSPFRGKHSPHHFFWGSFDLSGTRFSGRPAKPPQATGVMKRILDYAENEENFAYGFWPGDERYPHAAYYVYMHPEPPNFDKIKGGGETSYSNFMGEFLYPYDALRKTKKPDAALLNFLETLYTEGAKLAGWDIRSLEGPIPPGIPPARHNG